MKLLAGLRRHSFGSVGVSSLWYLEVLRNRLTPLSEVPDGQGLQAVQMFGVIQTPGLDFRGQVGDTCLASKSLAMFAEASDCSRRT